LVRSAARHALGAGPAERVSERRGRSQDGCARSRRCASIAERPSGGSSDIRGAITGHPIRSPGQITAQVTENIYDSPTGRICAVPQGTRVVGQYDNNVQFGRPSPARLGLGSSS
jgi:hypothetical protein